MAGNDVELKIVADLNKLTADVNSFVKSATTGLSKVEQSAVSLSAGFGLVKTAAVAAVAAFSVGKIVGFFETAVEEANSAEVAANDLAFAFEQAGVSAAEAVPGFEKFAEQIQATTIYQDDAVTAAAAHIEQLIKLDEEGLKRATQAAVTLAAVLGIDLESASQHIIKAHEGHTESLSKLGFSIKKGKTDAETYANALAVIESKSGAAENKTKTFSGAIIQASNNFSDIFEEIGKVIIKNDALVKVVNLASTAFANLSNYVQENAGHFSGVLTDSIKLANTALIGMLSTVKYFGSGLYTIRGVIAEFNDYMKQLTGETKKSDGAAAKLADTQAAFNKTMDEQIKKLLALQDALKKNADGASKLADKNSRVADSMKDIEEAIPKDLAALQKELEKVGKNQLQIIKSELDARLNVIKETTKSEDESAELTAKARQDAADKSAAYVKALIGDVGKTQEQKDADVARSRQDALNEYAKSGLDTAEQLAAFQTQLNSEVARQRDAETAKGIKKMIEGLQQAANVLSNASGLAQILKEIDEFSANIPKTINDLTAAGNDALEQMKDRIPGILEELADQLANEGKTQEEIDAAIKKRRDELESEIAIKTLQLQEDLAKKEHELQDELNKKKKDADEKTIEAGQKTISGLAGFILDKWIPGLGSVVKQILDALFEGGNYLGEAVAGIVNALPAIVNQLGDAVVNLITSFLSNTDEATAALGESLKKIPETIVNAFAGIADTVRDLAANIGPAIQSLIEGFFQSLNKLQEVMPQLVFDMIKSLGDNLPLLIKGLLIGVINGLANSLISGFESIINGFIDVLNFISPFDDIKKISLKRVDVSRLATGGTVPSGFSNDSFGPAALSSGEMVLPKDDVSNLRSFLAEQKSENTSGLDMAALIGALDKSSEKQVTINLVLDQKTLAKTILDLNRQGFRVSA